MPRGIIYIMSTVVPGLIKIGKTGSDNFEKRMYGLERNGYFNITGLRREFAIETDDYDEKESMLDDIFSRSRVPGSELFALDLDLAVQLLSSFEGRQVYPIDETKSEVFDRAAGNRPHEDADKVPDGIYTLSRKSKITGSSMTATMRAEDGVFIVAKGTAAMPEERPGLSPHIKKMRDEYLDSRGIVLRDATFASPSAAASFILGGSCNGWVNWKTEDGRPIDVYRRHER